MSAFALAAPVGNSLDNEPGDILGLKKILSNLGFMEAEDSPHGYLTRALDGAIRAFQDSLGLKATVAKDPLKKRLFLDNLADARNQIEPYETGRNDYFRYSDE